MTPDETAVRARWPDAAAEPAFGRPWTIIRRCNVSIGTGPTEAAAWADAARRIRDATPDQPRSTTP